MSATQDVTLYTDSSGKHCHSESIPSTLTTSNAQINTITANFVLSGDVWVPQVLVEVDPVQGASVEIDIIHHEIHEGEFYAVSSYQTLSSNNTFIYMVTCPANKRVHMRWNHAVSNGTRFEIYESPTTTANGTAQTPINHNRASANTSTTTIHKDPTVTVNGTSLRDSFLPGSNQSGSNSIGLTEIVLKQGLKYLFKITSLANGNVNSMTLDWYEESV